MRVFCPTTHAILLLVRRDEKGVYQVVAGDNAALPGLVFPVDAGLPIQAQLVKVAEKKIGRTLPPTTFDILQEVAFSFSYEEKIYTLYALQLIASSVTEGHSIHWKYFPTFLREMPPAKSRVAYLKMWQLVAGVGEQEIRVIEKKK
jgi:hypothetical protein